MNICSRSKETELEKLLPGRGYRTQRQVSFEGEGKKLTTWVAMEISVSGDVGIVAFQNCREEKERGGISTLLKR